MTKEILIQQVKEAKETKKFSKMFNCLLNIERNRYALTEEIDYNEWQETKRQCILLFNAKYMLSFPAKYTADLDADSLVNLFQVAIRFENKEREITERKTIHQKIIDLNNEGKNEEARKLADSYLFTPQY